jgi:hypothetical protein
MSDSAEDLSPCVPVMHSDPTRNQKLPILQLEVSLLQGSPAAPFLLALD